MISAGQLVECPSMLKTSGNATIFSDTIDMKNVQLCVMLVFIELYLCILCDGLNHLFSVKQLKFCIIVDYVDHCFYCHIYSREVSDRFLNLTENVNMSFSLTLFKQDLSDFA